MSSEAMISYSYCAEDVVLQRAFAEQSQGFYIDVGANHHQSGSVTKHFYDTGWSGINVEPQPDLHRLLQEHRPRDTNVCFCCSSSSGKGSLNKVVDENGLSTVEPDVAKRHESDGKTVERFEIEFRTLDSIVEAGHPNQPIDFVSIDVEGHELQVLQGFDLSRWRPKVLLVEATEPYTTRLNCSHWEGRILESGYRRTLFDGINLFFVREDLPELIERLSYPANPLDNFIPKRFVAAVDRMNETSTFGAAALSAANLVQNAISAVKRPLKAIGVSRTPKTP